MEALRRRRYLVKGGFTAPAVRDCIRVTLADAEVMAGFVGALEATVSEVHEWGAAR